MSIVDPNSTNALITQPFGTGAANPTYISLPIPVASQIGTTVNAASFTDGFPPATMIPEASGGLPFFGQQLNGILYMVTANVAAYAAGYLPTFSATRASALGGYPVGALVQMNNGTSDGYWFNIAANNSNNPDTYSNNSIQSNWFPLATPGATSLTVSSGTYDLTNGESACSLIQINGVLAGNVSIVFRGVGGQSWTVANNTTGAYTVTLYGIEGSSGASVAIPQGSSNSAAQNIFTDGINMFSNNVSTAGLAPIASPALTGTPTAPTAASSSNTTQIATTAMVQSAITAGLGPYATKASPIFTGTPTAPTAGAGTNTTQLATTAFVTAAAAAVVSEIPTVPDYRAGTFTCTNGTVTVNFSSALAFTPIVTVTWSYTSPNVGYIVPGSISATGFQYTNGNAGTCQYIALKPK
jgi:hypothetical protein